VKDSDNQLNNSALSGAEFATFYAKLRPKRVKSSENRKNAKRSRNRKSAENRKSAKWAKSGQLPAPVALACTAGAHAMFLYSVALGPFFFSWLRALSPLGH
jgi:hypothetical protein